MENKKKRKKWIFYLLLVLPLIYLKVTYHYSMRFLWENNPGLSFVKGQTVYYYGYNKVKNYSIFPKRIQIRAFSDLDKRLSLIMDDEIAITSLIVEFDGENSLQEHISEYFDTFFIPPFGECVITILGEAPYGGKGKGTDTAPILK